MSCHVGSPLQCGHPQCNRTVVSEVSVSRGHINYASLRNHFEKYFNQKLHNPRSQSNLHFDLQNISEARQPEIPLPDDVEYQRQYTGGSSSYLCKERRNYRLKQNYDVLGVPQEDIEVRGYTICSGFSYAQRHFPCADKIPLNLDTAMLIFVPSVIQFTVAPTCDYCNYVMSLMSRSVAAIPVPYIFGRNLGLNNRHRVGIGSLIDDPTSLKRVLEDIALELSPKAQKYAKRKELNPEDIFFIDFETVRRSARGLPLCPIEITVRDGNGNVIVDCLINEEGVTNAEYEAYLKRSGFTDADIRGARRIRGLPHDKPPRKAMTSKQIVQILINKGLNPESLWIEYSISGFDWRCMEVLIKNAGMPVESILPTSENTWTVAKDFACALPGRD
ncbi:hypothetical protein EDD36DRAFT_441121 [Exophiala viscosa]|uniref:Uncharacterized protein n=1 Tax=Exophiala viscosa TaxID=2486360 RepID=A0AAN6IB37_9EURO|nr:hypothetical protein EDD36DRAFT_441121 [Exophiala viscosa]